MDERFEGGFSRGRLPKPGQSSLATGRLPATNAEELKVMVHKILDYDKAVGTGAGKKWGRAIVNAEYENYLDQAGGVKKTTTGRWFLLRGLEKGSLGNGN